MVKLLSEIDSLRADDSAHLIGSDVAAFEKLLLTKSETFWVDLGAKKALRLFHAAAERVPAYKDFLKREGIRHASVKTIGDFSGIPLTDAKNYIAAYPLAKRCWDGKLSSTQFIATSSGTKGEPKFWPRSPQQDFEAALIHEFLYRTYFQFDRHSTLLLIGFPMGIYISGIATLLPSWLSSLKHRKMTIMSIGNNKAEIIRAVRNLSGSYDQTVLVGHPFFIKDVLETGAQEGIKWSKNNLGLMFCSEGFSEEWRSYIINKAGLPPASMRVFNTYGSSEMLLMAYETPFSIAVKKLAEGDSGFLSAFTGDAVAPQFFQYNPLLRYIESVKKELIFTSASGLPLVRFNIRDRGDVFSLRHLEDSLRAADVRLKAPRSHLEGPASRLPIVALWGRSDDTLKFHGVNIYPEHIKVGLNRKQFLRTLTGKFVMRKFLGKKMDQFFEINLELSPGVVAHKKLTQEIQLHVTETLLKINLEYHDMSSHVKKDVRPRVVLWHYQDPKYFKPGLKPHYLERT